MIVWELRGTTTDKRRVMYRIFFIGVVLAKIRKKPETRNTKPETCPHPYLPPNGGRGIYILV